jgi:hypothetical protein
MRFINEVKGEKLNTNNSTKLLFDNKANLIDDEKTAYAKSISIELNDNKVQRKYFIRTYNGAPLDPIGSSSRRNIIDRTELKLVSYETFDFYLSYLKTKNGLFLTKANRSFING